MTLFQRKELKRFYKGDFTRFSPIVRAFQYFINENKIGLNGLSATVIGDGDLVGKPIAYFLARNRAKVTVLSNYDWECKIFCQLLVLSTGVSNLVKGENIEVRCSVVDFGSSVVDSKCVGDLDMNSKLDHLSVVSPSPGGMGPLVVRFLLMNFLGI